MAESKLLSNTPKIYLSVDLSSGPSPKGTRCLSAEPWHSSDIRSQQPIDRLLQPCRGTKQHNQGKYMSFWGMWVSLRCPLKWTGKTPPAVKRQCSFGVRVGKMFQQDTMLFPENPGSSLTQNLSSCILLPCLQRQLWCLGTSSYPDSGHFKGRDANKSWS